jgi:serine/threonine protein kinase
MTATLSLMPGAIVGGHYVIGSLINRGGFGAVYRGTDTSEGNRPCAIKETYDVTPSARRQALMEAAVLFTIDSSHLPQVYDAFEDTGRFYLVMQLIEGQNLLEISRQRDVLCSEQEVLRWLLPVTEVLYELHNRHPAVMHRDIKPGNIIITPDQTAVLVDFGLTKLYDPGADTHTSIRAVSEGFSPIEQYLGKTSPQSDIYSLAATMYFMLTGQVPLASIQRSVHDTLIPPRQLNPRLSPHVEQALLTALSLNADYRYPSMRDFARALQAPQPPQQPIKLAQPSQPAQPVFSGHADSTIASSRVEGGSLAGVAPAQAGPSQQARQIDPTMPSSAPAVPIAPPPPPPQRASRPPRQNPLRPSGQRSTPWPGKQVAYPYLPPRPQVSSPAPQYPTYRPLPGASSQGCLWGLLQGVLSALLLLSLKNPGYFNVAILEGLCFYLVAGYFTTRKGGSSWRGIWAGFWSGIASTIVFWLVLFIGLLVRVVPRLRLDTNAGPGQSPTSNLGPELSAALQQVAPALTSHTSSQQSVVTSLLVGLLCAMGIGLLGGYLGTLRFRARMRRKGYV